MKGNLLRRRLKISNMHMHVHVHVHVQQYTTSLSKKILAVSVHKIC